MQGVTGVANTFFTSMPTPLVKSAFPSGSMKMGLWMFKCLAQWNITKASFTDTQITIQESKKKKKKKKKKRKGGREQEGKSGSYFHQLLVF